MARIQDANTIQRGTYAWNRLVDYCENDDDYQDIEGFKSRFNCDSGYDVAYDKNTGEIVLIDKSQSHIIETNIYRNEIGF